MTTPTPIRVTGTIVRAGVPQRARVEFRLTGPMYDQTGVLVEEAQLIICETDPATGHLLDPVDEQIGVKLSATNDPGTQPTGLAYKVRIITPRGADDVFYLQVPFNAPGGTIDLATAPHAGVFTAPIFSTYIPLSAVGVPGGVMGLDGGGEGASLPKHHKATHATGGDDPLTPADIGADVVGAAVALLTGNSVVSGAWSFSTAPTVPANAFPESAISGLTGDLAARALASRQIIAGTGLSGGGTLTADRTLTVAYGTTSGTAAQGNDSRIVGAEQAVNRGVAGGYASLDGGGKVPVAQIPAISLNTVWPAVSQAAMLALAAEPGDVAVRSDVSQNFMLATLPASVLGNWVQLADVVYPTDPAAGVGGLRTLGTGGTQAVSGTDARLSDMRTPLDLSVTDAKVALGAGILKSKLANLAIVDGDVSVISQSKISGLTATLGGLAPKSIMQLVGANTAVWDDVKRSDRALKGDTSGSGHRWVTEFDSHGVTLVVRNGAIEQSVPATGAAIPGPIGHLTLAQIPTSIAYQFVLTAGTGTSVNDMVIGCSQKGFVYSSVQFSVSPNLWRLFWHITGGTGVIAGGPGAGDFAVPLAQDGATVYQVRMTADLGSSRISDATVTGGTNLHSDLTTFTADWVGRPYTSGLAGAPSGLYISAFVDAHNVTLSAACTNTAGQVAVFNNSSVTVDFPAGDGTTNQQTRRFTDPTIVAYWGTFFGVQIRRQNTTDGSGRILAVAAGPSTPAAIPVAVLGTTAALYQPGTDQVSYASGPITWVSPSGNCAGWGMFALDDWNTNGQAAPNNIQQTLFSVWNAVAGQRVLSLYFAKDTRKMTLVTSSDGGSVNIKAQQSDVVPVVNGAFTGVGFTRQGNVAGNTVTKFWYSPNLGITWIQVGATVTQAGTTAIFAPTDQNLDIGCQSESLTANYPLRGMWRSVTLREGSDGTSTSLTSGGTLIANPDASTVWTPYPSGTYTDTVGNIFAIGGARTSWQWPAASNLPTWPTYPAGTTTSLRFPGDAAGYVLTANPGWIPSTGLIDLRAVGAADLYAGNAGADQTIFAKSTATGNQRTFIFNIQASTKKLQLIMSPDGTTLPVANTATSTAPLTTVDGAKVGWRATVQANTPGAGQIRVIFYTSTDNGATWNTLGAAVDSTPAVMTMFAGTSPIRVGVRDPNGTKTPFKGSIDWVQLIDSGTEIAYLDNTSHWFGYAGDNGFYTDSEANIFTPNGSTLAWLATVPTTVPASRVLTAGTGLTGGGDLSADRTFALPNVGPGAGSVGDASHTVAITLDAQGRVTALASGAIAIVESQVTGLVADLASKAPTSRQITAGTGLTGGGDLSADRTFAVAYGTTAGTAAQGNDSRFVSYHATLITGNGTFTVPTGVTVLAAVTCATGGGGGGGGGAATGTTLQSGGGGGAAGAVITARNVTVASAQALTAAIGSGGTSGTAGSAPGGAGGNGGNGGVTSLTGSSPTVNVTAAAPPFNGGAGASGNSTALAQGGSLGAVRSSANASPSTGGTNAAAGGPPTGMGGGGAGGGGPASTTLGGGRGTCGTATAAGTAGASGASGTSTGVDGQTAAANTAAGGGGGGGGAAGTGAGGAGGVGGSGWILVEYFA